MKPLANETLHFIQNNLKGFVYKRVKDKVITEDIVHDVFMKVQTNIGQLEDSEKLTSWIYQIARNTISDHFRKESKTFHQSELDWDSEATNFNACVSGYLAQLLSTLPDKYREALQLADIENVSQLKVAELLGISYSGAKSRVQRGRQMLKDRMNEVLIIKTDAYGNAIVCKDRSSKC